MGAKEAATDSPRFDREEMAHREVGHTTVPGPVAGALVALFLFTIASIPVLQSYVEIRDAYRSEGRFFFPQVFRIWSWGGGAVDAFARTDGSWWRRVNAANRRVLEEIEDFEDLLEDSSVFSRAVLPPTQMFLARLGAGNEKAYIGRDAWLFYRPDVDYVTSEGFLAPSLLQRRQADGRTEAPIQPDPRPGIVGFRDQLSGRGIELVVVPTPSKATIHPEQFSAGYSNGNAAPQNPSFEQCMSELKDAGVHVFDPTPFLVDARDRSGAGQFLSTDTHWQPEAMEMVAARLAEFIEGIVGEAPGRETQYSIEPASVSNLGDVAVMLRLPESQRVFAEQAVNIRQVVDTDGAFWRPDKSAAVLVLGDSFSNIFSLGEMGWGESAGLVEHLAHRLQRPVDCILRNDAGAHATREVLAQDLSKGRDRLTGKRVVVWQMAAREFAFGNWKHIELKPGTAPHRSFFVPSSGEALAVSGTIIDVSPAPRPGTVPYKDHIVAVHLADVASEGGEVSGGDAVIYMWSMRDNVQTAAARYRPGAQVRLRVRPWADVAGEFERFNRSELSDESLQFEEPGWGESVESSR